MNIYNKCLQLLESESPEKMEESIRLNQVNTTAPKICCLDTEECAWLCNKVYYISDIHLEHKIAKEFPSGASNIDIIYYVSRTPDKVVDVYQQIVPYDIPGFDTSDYDWIY